MTVEAMEAGVRKMSKINIPSGKVQSNSTSRPAMISTSVIESTPASSSSRSGVIAMVEGITRAYWRMTRVTPSATATADRCPELYGIRRASTLLSSLSPATAQLREAYLRIRRWRPRVVTLRQRAHIGQTVAWPFISRVVTGGEVTLQDVGQE